MLPPLPVAVLPPLPLLVLLGLFVPSLPLPQAVHSVPSMVVKKRRAIPVFLRIANTSSQLVYQRRRNNDSGPCLGTYKGWEEVG